MDYIIDIGIIVCLSLTVFGIAVISRKAVKHNNIHLQKEVLKVAMERSFNAFEELIQVMAMIHKYEMYLNQFPEEQAF